MLYILNLAQETFDPENSRISVKRKMIKKLVGLSSWEII